MNKYALIVATVAIGSLIISTAVTEQKDAKLSAEAARGKYVVQIAGCNDCHTPGYTSSAGKVDEKLWLTGDQLGWRGPWGTTYASNLRLTVKDMSADQFVKYARSEFRPPMPWFNLRDTDRPRRQGDLRLPEASRANGPARAALRARRQDARRTGCRIS